jgi:hypothetical protein
VADDGNPHGRHAAPRPQGTTPRGLLAPIAQMTCIATRMELPFPECRVRGRREVL